MTPYDKINFISSSDGNSSAEDEIITIDNKYFKVSQRTVLLLHCLCTSGTTDEAIQKFLTASPTSYTYEQVLYIIDNAINPLFDRKEPHPEPYGFLLKRVLIPGDSVKAISARLSFLFNRYTIFFISILSAVLSIVYLLQPGMLTYDIRLNIEGIMAIASATILSSFIHEFGHASACINYGIDPGHIGFGVYLNFPLFYTDVTKIWLLPSRQRHAVNFAGVYFQCILLTVLFPVYFISGNEVLKFIILTVLLSFTVTLNPFFKFDGYWIIADILDIPNLREHTYIWLKSLFGKGSDSHKQESLINRLSKTKLVIFIAYSICSTAFMLFYFIYLIPHIVIFNAGMFVNDLSLMMSYVTHFVTPPFSIVKNVLSYIIFVSTVCFFCYGMIKAVIKRP